ncbi:hypothetical protein NDU88_001381 [Pleurodeles waltl]|uniref:Uncharacterized protein n=1 Tax=Pleurodeles waltl TaxID=8319 RepID=A0AAV7UVW7_PLEWA|nr:hypothetical protein NDU88_001381 [Pleurodeles waltl]
MTPYHNVLRELGILQGSVHVRCREGTVPRRALETLREQEPLASTSTPVNHCSCDGQCQGGSTAAQAQCQEHTKDWEAPLTPGMPHPRGRPSLATSAHLATLKA